jgi:hypothetical protein
MTIRAARTRFALLGLLVLAATVTACGADASGEAAPSGGSRVLPPVEGFEYRVAGNAVSVFADSARDTLGGSVEVALLDAVFATRGGDAVLTIAFGFPGTSDEQAVDNMARILDGLEDGFQAGSQPALGGKAYMIQAADNQTIVMGPWGRSNGDLVFLFTLGPDQATRDLADAILTSGRE